MSLVELQGERISKQIRNLLMNYRCVVSKVDKTFFIVDASNNSFEVKECYGGNVILKDGEVSIKVPKRVAGNLIERLYIAIK